MVWKMHASSLKTAVQKLTRSEAIVHSGIVSESRSVTTYLFDVVQPGMLLGGAAYEQKPSGFTEFIVGRYVAEIDSFDEQFSCLDNYA